MITPPVSRYQQVAAQLRDAITRGDYLPGQELPTQTELAQTHRLNQSTINKAVRLLVAEGLVEVESGRRARVREHRPLVHVSTSYVTRTAGGGRAQWSSELERQGLSGRQEIRDVDTTAAPDDVAAWLRLDDDDSARVVARSRVMFIDDEPVQLSTSYYPAVLADGTELADPAPMRGGTIAALERLGVTLGRFREEISTRHPNRAEAVELGLRETEPVIRHVRITYADDGAAVEVSDTIMSNRLVLAYDLPAEP